MLRSYHPGVFRGDKWSCCHQRDRTGAGRWPRGPGGAGQCPPCGDTAVPQGWDVTGPGTASPCRTGVTPWTPRWRLSASSSTCTACGRPSGESLPRGHPPALPLQPLPLLPRPVPLLLLSPGKSTGSCWSRRMLRTAPGAKVGLGWGVLGMLWLGAVPRARRGLWWFGVSPGELWGLSVAPLPQTLPCPRG